MNSNQQTRIGSNRPFLHLHSAGRSSYLLCQRGQIRESSKSWLLLITAPFALNRQIGRQAFERLLVSDQPAKTIQRAPSALVRKASERASSKEDSPHWVVRVQTARYLLTPPALPARARRPPVCNPQQMRLLAHRQLTDFLPMRMRN